VDTDRGRSGPLLASSPALLPGSRFPGSRFPRAPLDNSEHLFHCIRGLGPSDGRRSPPRARTSRGVRAASLCPRALGRRPDGIVAQSAHGWWGRCQRHASCEPTQILRGRGRRRTATTPRHLGPGLALTTHMLHAGSTLPHPVHCRPRPHGAWIARWWAYQLAGRRQDPSSEDSPRKRRRDARGRSRAPWRGQWHGDCPRHEARAPRLQSSPRIR
jgi:hypothetical protein